MIIKLFFVTEKISRKWLTGKNRYFCGHNMVIIVILICFFHFCTTNFSRGKEGDLISNIECTFLLFLSNHFLGLESESESVQSVTDWAEVDRGEVNYLLANK